VTARSPEVELDAGQARRIALAAQGFDVQRPRARAELRHVRRALASVAALQLDSVNVLCRSHYMPVFSRIGAYDRAILDALAEHEPVSADGPARSRLSRELFEYWAHQASLIPIGYQPLFRWRMARAEQESWNFVARVSQEQPELIERVLGLVAERGPLRGSEASVKPTARAERAMWEWSDGKNALEYLFYEGRVSTARRVRFERFYDLTERVLPKEILDLPTPPEEDAQRQLLRIAAARLGVATEDDLGDYFRLPRKVSRARVSELIEEGELQQVGVERWPAPGLTLGTLRPARRINARALLSPFDSLIWSRKRTTRLFGFDYRLEIYVPAAKRVYGYYVLPFLLGETLVARVDLKSDRQAGALLVLGAFAEHGVDRAYVAGELAAELRQLADWLGLERIEVPGGGDLSRELADAVKSLP
jgi:uncharacterized protein YcaQ